MILGVSYSLSASARSDFMCLVDNFDEDLQRVFGFFPGPLGIFVSASADKLTIHTFLLLQPLQMFDRLCMKSNSNCVRTDFTRQIHCT